MTEAAAGAGAARLLFLAPNWLGDVVMAAPVLDRLHAATAADGSPLAVTLAVRPAWAPLFSRDPRLQGLLPVHRQGRHGGLAGLWRLAGDLRRPGFAAALLGPPSLRAALVTALAGIPLRCGRAGDGRGPLLSVRLPVPPRGERHYRREMEELADRLLAAAGWRPGPAAPQSDPLPGCATIAPAATGQGPPLWILAPGASYGQAKTWPVARAGAFCDAAVGGRGVRLVVMGDAAAGTFAAALRGVTRAPWRETLPGEAAVIDLTGRTDLIAAVGLLKAAAGFVGIDSGLMHLSAALGTPTLGLFGSSNPDWTAPLGPRAAVIAASGFPCRPCYRRRCNQPVFCLDTIAGDQVLEGLERLIAGPETGGGS